MLRISALSPFGPIFGKELRTTARRKRTYFLRFLYLLVLLLVMWGIYLESRPSRYSGYDGSVARRAQQAANLGHEFFAGFIGFSIISLALISPVLTATSINAERMGKTLHVLLMTPITSWQIVSGKLLSRLLAAITLIGLSLPVLAVVRLLGGVDLDRMFWAIVLCLITSLFTAAIGLFFSTFMNRAYAVILLAYAAMLFLYLFVPFILALMIQPRGQAMEFARFIAAINPFFIAIAGIGIGERPFSSLSPMPTVIVHLIGTAVLVLWSGAVLRKLARKQSESSTGPVSTEMPRWMPPADVEATPSQVMVTEAPPTPAVLPYATPAKAGPSKSRTVSDNPVLWREIRRPLTSKRWQAIVFTLGTLGLLFLSYIALANDRHSALSDAETQIGYAWVFCGLVMLLTCVLSATAIAGEKESDTWTLLLATPINARTIVLGKLAGQFRRLLWPSVLIVAHFTLFFLFGDLRFPSYCIILWIIFTFNVIWLATGVYFSLRVHKVTFAVILNLLMPVTAYGIVALALLILGNLVGERNWIEAVGWYLPYGHLVSAVQGYRYANDFRLPYEHSGTTADIFLLTIIGVGICYLVVAFAIVRYTIFRFDRIVGRAVQRKRAVA